MFGHKKTPPPPQDPKILKAMEFAQKANLHANEVKIFEKKLLTRPPIAQIPGPDPNQPVFAVIEVPSPYKLELQAMIEHAKLARDFSLDAANVLDEPQYSQLRAGFRLDSFSMNAVAASNYILLGLVSDVTPERMPVISSMELAVLQGGWNLDSVNLFSPVQLFSVQGNNYEANDAHNYFKAASDCIVWGVEAMRSSLTFGNSGTETLRPELDPLLHISLYQLAVKLTILTEPKYGLEVLGKLFDSILQTIKHPEKFAFEIPMDDIKKYTMQTMTFMNQMLSDFEGGFNLVQRITQKAIEKGLDFLF